MKKMGKINKRLLCSDKTLIISAKHPIPDRDKELPLPKT